VREPAKHQSGVKGVHYRTGAWQAQWRQGGETKTKSFSCNKYGFEEAKQMAIAPRREMERLHYLHVGKGAD